MPLNPLLGERAAAGAAAMAAQLARCSWGCGGGGRWEQQQGMPVGNSHLQQVVRAAHLLLSKLRQGQWQLLPLLPPPLLLRLLPLLLPRPLLLLLRSLLPAQQGQGRALDVPGATAQQLAAQTRANQVQRGGRGVHTLDLREQVQHASTAHTGM